MYKKILFHVAAVASFVQDVISTVASGNDGKTAPSRPQKLFAEAYLRSVVHVVRCAQET